MTPKPNPPQWAIDAAAELFPVNEEGLRLEVAAIIARHAPQSPGQPSDIIREKAARAAININRIFPITLHDQALLKLIGVEASAVYQGKTALADIIAAEFAGLPDPEAVRELVEAVRDYFGAYPGTRYMNAKDERIYAALAKFQV